MGLDAAVQRFVGVRLRVVGPSGEKTFPGT